MEVKKTSKKFGSVKNKVYICTQLKRYIVGWQQMVARQAHNLKVGGSNPSPATSLKQKRSLKY